MESCDAVRVNGIAGLSMTVTETGHMDSFFRVHSSEKVKANVLSFAEVEDMFKIMYQEKDSLCTYMIEI